MRQSPRLEAHPGGNRRDFPPIFQDEPAPKTQLRYADPFTLLVAVVLSAQATNSSVNKATPDLFKAADTPEKMIALGEPAVTEKIKTIGMST